LAELCASQLILVGALLSRHRARSAACAPADPVIVPILTSAIGGGVMPQVPQHGAGTVSFRLKVRGSDWAFREISGLGSESEVIEVRGSGAGGGEFVRVLPGAVKVSSIELKRGVDVDKGLWEWRKQVVDGRIRDARANGTIEVIDHKGDPIAVYLIENAWPSKYTGAEMSLESGPAFESITIVSERIERIE
jgi:phage tail-like protein